MDTKRQSSPLIVILGVTASGKSSLAMELARKYDGEIICADSRTVYKGMDIGTAKPTTTDRNEIRHHILDVVDPSERFTAAEFKRQATAAIEDILSRGKIPILSGGTGLYIDGLIFDFAFLPPASLEDREYLQSMTVVELQDKVKSMDLDMPENNSNPRHLIRTIETNGAVPVKKDIRKNTLVIGLDINKETIEDRIQSRSEAMIEDGLQKEVESLYLKYGWESPGLSAVGYREWVSYFEGRSNLEYMLKETALSNFVGLAYTNEAPLYRKICAVP